MYRCVLGLLAFLLLTSVHAQTAPQKALNAETSETSHLTFVTEYVHELFAIETLRAAGEQELKQGHEPSETFSAMVYTSSRMQFELRAQINTLKSMHLDPPFEELIPNLMDFYAQKIELWRQLGEIASAFISGPKQDVDYGKLAASMPQIRANP